MALEKLSRITLGLFGFAGQIQGEIVMPGQQAADHAGLANLSRAGHDNHQGLVSTL